MNLILIITLAISLNLGHFAEAETCTQAKTKLEVFFKKTENNCAHDSDCDGFFFRADSCERAVILPKSVVTKSFEGKLIQLQTKVRTACEKEFSGRGPCGPQPFTAVCKNKKCVDLVH